MIRAGRSSAQAITRARILLKTDEGWTASQVAVALDISERTVFRAKRRYAEEGVGNQQKWHSVRPERSGAGLGSRKLP